MALPEKILIIKLGAFGDFVQALGPMRAIRAAHPGATFTLLTTAPFEELARQSGLFDAIWRDPRAKWYQPRTWMAVKDKFNRAQFTRVYDLQNNDRTNFYFKLFNPKPQWVGIAKGASHQNTSPLRTAGHSFDGHRQTLALAGIHTVPIDDLSWMKSDIARFTLTAPYVLIVPGASPKRPLKRWPASHYAALCTMLADKNYQPVIIGSAQEKSIAREIVTRCAAAIDLTGETEMGALPALARGAAFAVGNDTGPMHMIAPTGCASLILFSADSNAVKHKPLGPRVITLSQADLADLSPQAVWRYLEQENFLGAYSA